MQHVSAVRFMGLEEISLFHYSSGTYFFKEIIHIKNYCVNIALITAGTTNTTWTQLVKQLVDFRHLESERILLLLLLLLLLLYI
jgi:hypothetical protein